MVATHAPRRPQRGEVWWFDPEPTRGTELGKKVHPALVISVDSFNHAGPKVVVVPGTSQAHANNPFHVPFTYRLRGQQVTTYFCCDNVRAVDTRARLKSRMAPQRIPLAVLSRVEQHLRTIMGL